MSQSKHHNEIAIKLTGVSKKYEIHHEKPTLVEKFAKGRNETFWALLDINLTIKKGERVGIIGPNGSGKTTLLKIIAGITIPTSGKLTTNGKIVSLIDLEAGFHMDLTGIQNIYLNGMLLGMNKTEITKKLRSIINFSDIQQFIDVPLYTYSQGMKLKLGFSIAINADPDILILDETIFFGDINFQKRLQKKLRSYFHSDVTVLIVSHWFPYIQKSCKKLLVMNRGKLVANTTVTNLPSYKDIFIK